MLVAGVFAPAAVTQALPDPQSTVPMIGQAARSPESSVRICRSARAHFWGFIAGLMWAGLFKRPGFRLVNTLLLH